MIATLIVMVCNRVIQSSLPLNLRISDKESFVHSHSPQMTLHDASASISGLVELAKDIFRLVILMQF